MKRTIEIKTIKLGDLDPYAYMSYPSAGIYKHEKDASYLYFVANNMVYTVPENMLISEPPDAISTGITEETLLRSIAIMQKPELIIDLVKVLK